MNRFPLKCRFFREARLTVGRNQVTHAGKVFGLFLLAFSYQFVAMVAQPNPPKARIIDKGLIISGVTVVNVRDGSLSPGMAVVIEGEKIVKIVPSSSVVASAEKRTVDAHGKYMIPGYLDMHSHPLNLTDPSSYLKLMLVEGITGYRQMSGTPALLKTRREGNLNYPVGPELLAMSGIVMTDTLTPTPEAAAAEVRQQKADGADFIKTVGLSSANFFGAMKEAETAGIPYVGHLQTDVDVRVAAKGMRSIEHLGPMEAVLLGCSSDEAAIRKLIADTHGEPPQVGPASGAMADIMTRLIANPVMAVPPQEFVSMQRVLDTYDEAKCKELAAEFVADGTWQVPTLIRLRTMAIPDDPAYGNDPNLKFVAPATRQMWVEMAHQFPKKLSPSNRETLKQLFALQLRFTKLLEDSGVQMLAGTDTGGSQWVIAGSSIHQEFDLFAQAGLTPLQILRIATLNGAKFLGRENTMGTIEAGKNANLVLLDGNPLSDVANMHKISGVVRAGVYYDAPALSKLRATALP